RVAARTPARTRPPHRLPVLRARAAPVGRPSHRSADRRTDHGGGTGRRLLRGIRALPRAFPPQRGDRGRVRSPLSRPGGRRIVSAVEVRPALVVPFIVSNLGVLAGTRSAGV